MELWKDITNFEGAYQVSSLGRVKNTRTGYILKPSIVGGYSKVGLRFGKVKLTTSVHRLVAIAFMPNPEHKPQVNHMDGVKGNNALTNLEWCTNRENYDHAVRTGLTKPGYSRKRLVTVAKVRTNKLGWVHATANSYMNHGCRCKACAGAWLYYCAVLRGDTGYINAPASLHLVI